MKQTFIKLSGWLFFMTTRWDEIEMSKKLNLILKCLNPYTWQFMLNTFIAGTMRSRCITIISIGYGNSVILWFPIICIYKLLIDLWFNICACIHGPHNEAIKVRERNMQTVERVSQSAMNYSEVDVWQKYVIISHQNIVHKMRWSFRIIFNSHHHWPCIKLICLNQIKHI